ncbi:MAG: hypothetical protein CM15mP74_07630 [Halieaceae bacterium]|nr:MAG: hypothetical protein CM15mP74_07630 [Halieaceae bacterium]
MAELLGTGALTLAPQPAYELSPQYVQRDIGWKNSRSRCGVADWVQVIALALIQGVTEFLPVSSSAHLILPTEILGWDDQGLLFDVGVHAGTLCAVLWHFRRHSGVGR